MNIKNIIDDKNKVRSNSIKRGEFYLIKEYEYIDGKKGTYTDISAPIIFVLYSSIPKDIVHAVKISESNIRDIKKFFSKIFDTENEKIQIRGSSKKMYESVLQKMPKITNDSYRTYKLSGLGKIYKVNIDEEKLITKAKISEVKGKQRNEKNKK